MGSQTLTELFKGRYTFKAPRKYGGYFRKESDHRDFVSIGTAAGMAALLCLLLLTCPEAPTESQECASHLCGHPSV